MCDYFSAVSNGEGTVLFFTVEQIKEIMEAENPESYDFNSHASICHYYRVKEDDYNKWEIHKKGLVLDQLNANKDDRKSVIRKINDYINKLSLEDKLFLYDFYDRNTGDGNTGHWNTGHWNTGDGNTGHWNTGHWNTGHWNTGHRNTGHRNTGDRNTGDGNTGHWNTGDGNTGDGQSRSFCEDNGGYVLFDKECTGIEYKEQYNINWAWFVLTEWISSNKMIDEEKTNYPTHKTTGGYLKSYNYKQAWSKCPKSELEKIKKLKNFDADKFERMTGIKVD